MPRVQKDTDKQKALRQHGTLNPRPQDVRHSLFRDSEFFDPEDMIQVKYEMLRQVHVDNQPVSQAAHDFGFSRPSFYQANASFEQAGLSGLVPLKRGPRGGHKLTPEVMEFLVAKREAEPSLSLAQLAALVKADLNVQVHPRSIERQLLREKNGAEFRTDTTGASAESGGTDFQLRRTAAPVLEWALRSGAGCIHAAGYVGVDACLLCLQLDAANQSLRSPRS
jgi:transposase